MKSQYKLHCIKPRGFLASLAKESPRAAYSLLLGESASDLAKQRDPKVAYILASKVLMNSWGGVKEYWPEVAGFEIWGEAFDHYDCFRVTYNYGSSDLNLSAEFDLGNWGDFQNGKPGKWKATILNEKDKGSWNGADDIPRILADLVAKAKKVQANIASKLTKVGGPKWDVLYDWGELTADYENPNEYSEAAMTVTFQDVDNVVFGEEDKGEAEAYFTAGADYQGSYGKQEKLFTYKTLDDIEKVLKEAEKLWDRWIAKA
jgi:hypothetical protein